MKIFLLPLACLLLSLFYSCKKEITTKNPAIEIIEKISPEDFTFSNTKKVTIDVKVLSNSNTPIKGTLVEVKSSANTDDALFKALTDENGQIKTVIDVPAYLDTLMVTLGNSINNDGEKVSIAKNLAVTSILKAESIASSNDSDNDGVPDIEDEFPNDPNKAYVTYYPSKNNWGTLAFEDTWPKTGDYDLNDLVVSYRYAFLNNAQNEITEITGDFAAIAVGTSFQNGFGVEFPFSPTLVSKVTGQKHMSSYIKLAGNGLEADQTNAVIIPFDNSQVLISNYTDANFVNTKMAMPNVSGDTAHITILLTSPITLETLGEAPFNPFLISNLRRGYEVHLPGKNPTNQADKRLFQTADDASNTSGKMYLSKANWPWALNFTESFTYPIEEAAINRAYTHFFDWTNSGGTTFKNWYKEPGPEFRNPAYIYSK